MSCFDNSVVCYPQDSSPATYHSYMCQSGSQGTERLLNTVDYDQLWSVSQEQCTLHNKTYHISKLRNILSETITSITKDSRLRQGESVELTLEIQLMKTENNTPSNSMVEVTIIQHNKKSKNMNNDALTFTNLKKNEIKNSQGSDTASQKRRNWFQRVISRQNDKDLNNNNVQRNKEVKQMPKLTEDSGLLFDQKLKNSNRINSAANKHPRSNFIKILPEEPPIGGNFSKGYRRVSPEKKTPRVSGNPQNTGPEKHIVTRKKSLVNKLSEIFLPKKKSNKSRAVKTALTALKNEVDNIQHQTVEKHRKNKKRTKAPVHNLGKLVGNILDDMMDTSNNGSRNEMINSSKPLRYQNFFEPVSKTKVKEKEKKQVKMSKNLTIKKLAQSHSDTCCVHFKCDSSDLKVKASNSVSNFRVIPDSNNQSISLDKGDSTERTSTKNMINRIKNHKTNHKTSAKGDAANQSEIKASRKRLHKSNKKICAKKSLIEWNGQTVEVDKYVKTKIEMLIVNELNNLALKEGMECDVIPLHPSEASSERPVEKMSSFFCELDVNDNKFKKCSKNKKSSEAESISNQTSSKGIKKNQSISKLKQKRKTKKSNGSKTTAFQPMKKETQIITLDKNIKKQSMLNPSTGTTCVKTRPTDQNLYNNDLKITYVNTNTKNWSAESTALKFRSPETTTHIIKQNPKTESQTAVFKFGEENSATYQKAISSGFIKKIDSNDSVWKNYQSETKHIAVSDNNFSKQLVTLTNTKSSMKFSSSTSNEYQSSIEIELNIKDLEMILNEAKQKQETDKVLINAKCKQERKNQKTIRLTGKNCPSYTNQLLSSAAEKLEKYAKRKKK